MSCARVRPMRQTPDTPPRRHSENPLLEQVPPRSSHPANINQANELREFPHIARHTLAKVCAPMKTRGCRMTP